MTRHTFKNSFGTFTIEEYDGRYSAYGSIKASAHAFKEIGRRPPDKYGNFYGREKAGFAACKQLIENAHIDEPKEA